MNSALIEQILSARAFHLSLALLAGTVFQCLALLRRRPPKWMVITFILMLAYMGVLLYMAVSSANPEYLARNPLGVILPQVFSMTCIFAFLFIAIFLKEILRTIDERALLSLNAVFPFIFLGNLRHFSAAVIIIVIAISTAGTWKTARLVLTGRHTEKREKYILYGWFLFMNFIFAWIYFSELPVIFFSTGGLRESGTETIAAMVSMGMVLVHLFMNGGILYYTFIFTAIYRMNRNEVITYTEGLFSDEQVSGHEVLVITAAGALAMVLFLFFPRVPRMVLTSYWVVLSPHVLSRFRGTGRGTSGKSIRS